MDSTLRRLIDERLERTPALSARTAELVRAACRGQQALAEALRPEGAPPDPAAAGGRAVAARGAYLRSITVEGFRGAGPEATLALDAGPGLTLVVGRNGSGKSSFAEALEILLTGRNQRWEGRSKVWAGAWRNLHHGPTQVSAEFVVEGVATSQRLVRRWAEGADLEGSTLSSRGTVGGGLQGLGWEEAVEAHRPFLTHNEVGTRLDARPTDLHDALAGVLGLDELSAAVRRLADERLRREGARKAAEDALASLTGRLEASDDERARECLGHLRGREWDLGRLRAVLERPVEPGEGGSDLAVLGALARLPLPSGDDVAAAVEALREAAGRVAALTGTDADRARRTASLLDEALHLHELLGDADCPVCGRHAALTPEWRAATRAEMERLRREAQESAAAHSALSQAIAAARRLASTVPAALRGPMPAGIDAAAALEAWSAWERLPEGPAELAGHLAERHAGLAPAVTELAAAAGRDLERRQDAWRPLARELGAWTETASAAQAGMAPVADVRRAERWLKDAAADLRDERFRPIAEEAQRNWALLRQQSSVELGGIRLEGSSTSRRVRLDVSIDGEEGPALGVMSQGELNCLSLSLFLPRAMLPESPFRFVVIDDPVQAMDPAKVDGLARCLEASAERRQVVVFTHDDRLPAAIRSLGIASTILQVTRREGSVIEVRPSLDPVRQSVADALAVAATQETNPHAARVVPGFCRAAIEAACARVVRARRLRDGRSHEAVEEEFGTVTTVTSWLALAMLNDVRAGQEVVERIRRRFGDREAAAVERARRGAHERDSGDLVRLARDTERLTDQLLALP